MEENKDINKSNKVANGEVTQERKQKMSVSVAVRSIADNARKLKEAGLITEEEKMEILKVTNKAVMKWMDSGITTP